MSNDCQSRMKHRTALSVKQVPVAEAEHAPHERATILEAAIAAGWNPSERRPPHALSTRARQLAESGETLLRAEEIEAIRREPQPQPDPRMEQLREVIRAYAPTINDETVDLAAGSIHVAISALVSSRRRGGVEVRGGVTSMEMRWSPKSRSPIEGLRRLQEAAQAKNSYRWRKAWAELPPRAVDLLIMAAGGFTEFGRLPWLTTARPFGVPGPEGIRPLIPVALAMASTHGRPPELLRDRAVTSILRAVAAIQGRQEEPPTGWSNREGSRLNMLFKAVERVYGAPVPGEADVMHAGGRAALRLTSAGVMARLVDEAFPSRTR